MSIINDGTVEIISDRFQMKRLLCCDPVDLWREYTSEHSEYKKLKLVGILNRFSSLRDVLLWQPDGQRPRSWSDHRNMSQDSSAVMQAWIKSLGFRLYMTEEELEELIESHD